MGNGCECLAGASCLGYARAVSARVVSSRPIDRAPDRVLNGCHSASTRSPPIEVLAPASAQACALAKRSNRDWNCVSIASTPGLAIQKPLPFSTCLRYHSYRQSVLVLRSALGSGPLTLPEFLAPHTLSRLWPNCGRPPRAARESGVPPTVPACLLRASTAWHPCDSAFVSITTSVQAIESAPTSGAIMP